MSGKMYVAASITAMGFMGGSVNAATLLYQYNFDNVAPGATTASPNVGANGTLGMDLTGNNTPLATGVGPSGAATDIALANVGVNNTPNGSSVTGSNGAINGGNFTAPANNTVNLGTLNQFTVTMWVKQDSALTASKGGTAFSRLFMVGGDGQDTGSTTDGFSIALNNAGIETHVRNYGGVVTATGGQTFTPDQWQFIAVSVDLSTTNPYFSAGQQTASGGYSTNNTIVYRGTTSTAVAGFGSEGMNSNVTPFTTAPLPITVTNGFAYLLNRKDLTRGFNGNGDDFRIYDGLLSVSDLEAVRLSAVPEPASLGLLGLGGLTLLRRRRD